MFSIVSSPPLPYARTLAIKLKYTKPSVLSTIPFPVSHYYSASLPARAKMQLKARGVNGAQVSKSGCEFGSPCLSWL